MANYIDLVLAKNERMERPHLFWCPPWSYLHEGDSVMVETKYGKKEMTVVASFTEDAECETFQFIVKAANAPLPLYKVLGKMQYREFFYEDEGDDDSDNEDDGTAESEAEVTAESEDDGNDNV